MVWPIRRTGLLFAAFLFIGVFGTVLPAEFAEVRVAAQLLSGLTLAAWAILRLGRRPTPLDVPIVAALVALLVVALFSRDVQGSLEMLGGGLAAALLFWMMADVRSADDRASIAVGVVVAATGWLATFGVFWTMEKIDWLANGGGMPNLVESKQTLFWVTTNVTPVLTLLGFGFIGFMRPGLATRLLAGLFWIASAFTVPMSGGRAGWLGLAVAGIVLMTLGGRVRHMRPLLLKHRRRLIFAGAAAVALAAVLALTVAGRALDASGVAARLPLWREALAILAQDPMTGGGPGTYSWLRLEHIPAYHSPVPAVLAHNVVLQTLADGGVLLFAGLVAVIATLAAGAWRRRTAMSQPDLRAMAALIGFGFVCLLDDHSSLPAITAMVVTLAAWLTTPAETARPPARTRDWRRRGALLAAVGCLALISMPAVWRVDVGRLEAQAGRAALLDGNLGAAIAAFDRAVDAYPERPNYLLSAGLALALDGRTADARERYRRAAELAPADARTWGALAALAASDDERHTLAALAAAAPSADPRYQFSLGLSLEGGGEQGASLAYARALVRAPGVSMALGPAEADAAVDALLADLDSLSAEAQADPRQVRATLALAGFTAAGDLPPAWQAIEALQQGDQALAEDALAEAVTSDRHGSPTWHAAIALAEQRCDASALRSATTLASLVPGGDARPPVGTVYRSTDLVYREAGLAGYQPIARPFDPSLLAWPGPLLPQPETCAP